MLEQPLGCSRLEIRHAKQVTFVKYGKVSSNNPVECLKLEIESGKDIHDGSAHPPYVEVIKDKLIDYTTSNTYQNMGLKWQFLLKSPTTDSL